MAIATCLIRSSPHYRQDAFIAGLQALGFTVETEYQGRPLTTDNLLIIWNRYGLYDALARQFEAAGARVIVAENGYIGHDSNGHKLYALALNHHNGAGRWYIGEMDRSREQNLKLEPWRNHGDDIVILPQRGIGPDGVAMPKGWSGQVHAKIMQCTNRKVRIRHHPGQNPEVMPLIDDLSDAWAAVTWGSSAALKAIFAGIPVFYCFKRWIGGSAAKYGIEDLSLAYTTDRAELMQRISWAQWAVDEIALGIPFRYLLEL